MKEKISKATMNCNYNYTAPYIGDPIPGTAPIITDPMPVTFPSITDPLPYQMCGSCLCDSCSLKNSSACPRIYSNMSSRATTRTTTINVPYESEPMENLVEDDSSSVAIFRKIASALASQYRRKNEAYGDSFGKSVKHYGIISALTRMSDKWNRLENLMLNEEVKHGDESINDTLLDLATYCIMTVMATRNKSELDKIIKKLEG